MKSYLLALSVVFFSISAVFSQAENREGSFAYISKDLSSNKFTFSHEVDYFEAFENRLISELNKEKIVLESLSIADYRCEVVFKETLSIAECKENLSVLVRKLNFDSFQIK